MEIILDNVRQAEGILDNLSDIKEIIENRINLAQNVKDGKRINLNGNKIMRICLLVGLNIAETRTLANLDKIQLSKSSTRIPFSFLTLNDMQNLFTALLKLRYKGLDVDWNDNPTLSRIIAAEMYRGRDFLMKDENLNDYLLVSTSHHFASSTIPTLDLVIGEYGDDMEATLDINSVSVPNTQIIIAGATGSGKTNLLAVLINQFRRLTIETAYPVNFLLFDYKSEFSDPDNNHWLNLFDVDRSAILEPVISPLPFTPFKDFSAKKLNEVNVHSSEMAKAICSLDNASISANMNNRLS